MNAECYMLSWIVLAQIHLIAEFWYTKIFQELFFVMVSFLSSTIFSNRSIYTSKYLLTGSTGSWINVAARSAGIDLLGFSQWWVVRVAFFLNNTLPRGGIDVVAIGINIIFSNTKYPYYP